MKGHYEIKKVCIGLLMLSLAATSGCMGQAQKKTIKSDASVTAQEQRLKPLKAQGNVPKAQVIFTPGLNLSFDLTTQKIAVPDFGNTSSYVPAALIMRDAFIHVLRERGCTVVANPNEAEIIILGEVSKVDYHRALWTPMAIWSEIADGATGRVYSIEVSMKLAVNASVQSYEGSVVGKVQCKESDIASAVNYIGVRMAGAIARSISNRPRK